MMTSRMNDKLGWNHVTVKYTVFLMLRSSKDILIIGCWLKSRWYILFINLSLEWCIYNDARLLITYYTGTTYRWHCVLVLATDQAKHVSCKDPRDHRPGDETCCYVICNAYANLLYSKGIYFLGSDWSICGCCKLKQERIQYQHGRLHY